MDYPIWDGTPPQPDRTTIDPRTGTAREKLSHTAARAMLARYIAQVRDGSPVWPGVVVLDGKGRPTAWATAQAQALYAPDAFGGDTATCPGCLRSFDPVKAAGPGESAPHGGSPAIWCSPYCAVKGRQRRRGSGRIRPTADWRTCAVCATGYLVQQDGSTGSLPEGRVLCPPAWPASPIAASPCAKAYRARRRAERRADAEETARAIVACAWLLARGHRQDDPGWPAALRDALRRVVPAQAASDFAAAVSLDRVAVYRATDQVAAWTAHLAACAACASRRFAFAHRWRSALAAVVEGGLPPSRSLLPGPRPRRTPAQAAEDKAARAARAEALAARHARANRSMAVRRPRAGTTQESPQ
jgi:hypothetical protein